MRAFVLSGGGNRGALQVGALQVLLEAGIVPDMVVGVSVGAINGAKIAHDPTLRGVQELAHIWSVVSRDDLYPGNHLSALWSILRGKESLFTNRNWYRFIKNHLPCCTFSDIRGARCYVVATELNSGCLQIFGDQRQDSILDALMATCALPPLHPPYWIDGRAYIDGGATANLPLRVALERGATEIYALNIYSGPSARRARNIFDISTQALGALMKRQCDLDLEHCVARSDVWVRQINLDYPEAISPWDFSRTSELIAMGRESARQALAQGPLRPPSWQDRLAQGRERLFASLAATTTQFGNSLSPKERAESEVAVRH